MTPERERQFDLIAVASDGMLRWARAQGIALERIEPVVPFVETDFSLDAWLFLDTEGRIREYQTTGSAVALVEQFRRELATAGYPEEWLRLVRCHFASREVVDRDYQGSYFYFLR